ncbi:MAG: FimV/HubP family polar landmark protein [Moraxella sp.]|nr:FimV/HubP family polar landmark protein [Moraxella sp.]
MTKTLLFIAIALIVIAVIAWFVLQKLQNKQGRLPRLPSIDKQPNIKMADPRLLSDQDIANALSAQQAEQVQKPKDDLEATEMYVQNQDYPSAINELKRLLMTNPRHTKAMLKLLQVYGLTGQHVAFNQLHQRICEIADEKTVQEANMLKTLVDDGATNTQPPAPTPTPAKPVQINTIEFDKSTNQTASVKPTPQPVPQDVPDEVFELDFDINEPVQPQPSATPVSTHQTPEQTTPQNVVFGSDIDEIFKQTAPKPTQAPDELAELDELDFGFDTPSTALPNLQTTTDTAVNLDVPSTDGGLDLAPAPDIPKVQTDDAFTVDFALTDTDTKAQPSADLAFDFDFGTDSQDSMTAPQVAKQDDKPTNEYDFSQLSLETDTATQTASETTIKADDDAGLAFEPSTDATPSFDIQDTDNLAQAEVIQDKADDVGLAFGLDTSGTSMAPSFDPPKAEVTQADDFGDFSFDLASSDTTSDDNLSTQEPLNVAPAITVQSDVPKTDTIGDFDWADMTDSTPNAPPVATPAPASTLEASLTTPADDGIQVTLELAKQYIEFGEYDSAKRLLQEVAQDGSTPQKQEAQSLITTLA